MKAVTQRDTNYTAEDAEVWKLLFEQQMEVLPTVASSEYLEGLQILGLNADELPNFEQINAQLAQLTGWGIVAVPGIIDPVDFFPLLAKRRFPVTYWLRAIDQLEFLPEPDLFHDVIGHLPLLSNQVFCDFFQEIGVLGCQYLENPKAVAMLGCLYWYAVEFGVIRSVGDDVKMYGAGILSSYGEIQSALSETSEYLPFDTALILRASYNDSHIQDKYFVIESFEQLYHAIDDIRGILASI